MSSFIHSKYLVAFESELGTYEILLYFRLAIACGAQNRCAASVPVIAKWMHSSANRVRSAIKQLEKAGLLAVERSIGGAGRTHSYSILTPQRKEKPCVSKPCVSQPCISQPCIEETPCGETPVIQSENPVCETSETIKRRCPIKNNINKTSQRIYDVCGNYHTDTPQTMDGARGVCDFFT